MQIREIVLYSHTGDIRRLPLRTGSVNIITGGSKTGKSALIDIIEYCLGRTGCRVPEGVIRDTVSWYAVLLEHGGSQIFVAHKAPDPGRSSSTQVHFSMGDEVPVPPLDQLNTNTNAEALQSQLGDIVGITANLHVTPEGQTRPDLAANFSHTLLLLFQQQDEIASRRLLFHRQSDPFVAQAIRDTLPYFLGAVDEQKLAREQLLREAIRELSILERRAREREALRGRGFTRAHALVGEAMESGLIEGGDLPSDVEQARSVLTEVLKWQPSDLPAERGDQFGRLQRERAQALQDLADLQDRVRAAQSFAAEADGYSTEVANQELRLESIDLFPNGTEEQATCPVCESRLDVVPPTVGQIRMSLELLRTNLQTTTRDRPRLRDFLQDLEEKQAGVRQRIRDLELTIAALVDEHAAALRIRDENARRARVVGRVSLYLDSTGGDVEVDPLDAQLETARVRVRDLQESLTVEEEENRLTSALSRISSQMTDWSRQLELEHSSDPVRLDLSRLTLVVDRPDRPMTMDQIGSGENWVGLHIIAFLALHRWFVEGDRPVPHCLFLDQPTQVYFPADREEEMQGSEAALADEDRRAVRRLFDLILDAAAELAPRLQIVLTDHANLSDTRFQNAVVENWRHGAALIPSEWFAGPGSAELAE